MRPIRRYWLRALGSVGAVTAAAAAGLMHPLQALAAEWNKAAFDARTLADALRAAGVAAPAASADILIRAPEIAENGALVHMEIESRIAGTETAIVFVDRNPQPLAATFEFTSGVEPFIATRIKMGETSQVRVVVKAAGRFYFAAREVKVTIGGCG